MTAAITDPFPEIYTSVPTWIENNTDLAADLIAGGAPLLWRPGKLDGGRGGPDTPTRETVSGAITLGLATLSHCPGGVTFAGRHWCAGGHPDCPGGFGFPSRPGGEIAFEDAFGVGSHYTPRHLADWVVTATLEPLVYRPGPRETADRGAWRLRPAEELLGLKICDIALGAGAFTLAACRYLAERVAESWRRESRAGGVRQARRAVAEGCIYGVDVNPFAVALAELTLALASHVPGRPAVGPGSRFAVGDSLLGVDWAGTFPEVMVDGGFDAIVGNPPFLGGQKISGIFGSAYRDRLVAEIADGAKGSADLSAYFALRGFDLLNLDGQIGLIATDTLAQGATRRVGLDQITARGGEITWAIKSEPWPGADAAVRYCAVSVSRAPVADDGLRVVSRPAEIR